MCSIAARLRANALQFSIHDVSIHIAQRWVQKRLWQAAHNLKFKTLPQSHGPLVGAHYKIKLHRSKPSCTCAVKRMRAHRSRDAAPCCGNSRHITAIGHVRSATLLIRLQKVRSDNFIFLFRHEDLMLRRSPVRKRVFLLHIAWNCIRLARAHDRFHDPPDRITIIFRRRPN
jgi:hypothetical protein